ncbi:HTTM domain-containing protein [Polystyrenella longa]|nr:HTTM domain-containing protein [Polystyrenella longa]
MQNPSQTGGDGFWSRWTATWFEPVPIHGLVFFRIVFGLLIASLIISKYFGLDLIGQYYIKPNFHFTYYGFSWVKPLPPAGMYAVFWAMLAASLGVAFGFCYRFSAATLFGLWTYVFLLEKAVYQNHHYLAMLIAFVLIFIPAHRKFSLDALFRKKIRQDVAPAWSLWAIRILIAIPYIYGAFAKMNGDWLAARPLWIWINVGTISEAMPEAMKVESTAWFMSYYGLLFDLLVVPALFWGRTRLLACLGILAFHGSNIFLFYIGIFPPMMLASTLLFFPKDFFPNLVAAIKRERKFDWSLLWKTEKIELPETGLQNPTGSQRLAICSLVLFFGFQFLFPFRHLMYAGNPSWNGRGDLFAWRMMLDDKRGQAQFRMMDFKNKQEMSVRTLDPKAKINLSLVQQLSMLRQPDMVLEYAQFLEDEYVTARKGAVSKEDVRVYARVLASLNGRPYLDMINPSADLTEINRRLIESDDWIIPELPASQTPKHLSDLMLPELEK